MVVRVENRCQVPDQAIVTDNDTVIGHANRISVDKDTLAEHKGAILGSTYLDWYRLRAQEQTSARDRSVTGAALAVPEDQLRRVATAVPSNLPGLAKGFTIYAPA
jgi:hypothetical protein